MVKLGRNNRLVGLNENLGEKSTWWQILTVYLKQNVPKLSPVNGNSSYKIQIRSIMS
jgi:hypothetical protein